MSKEEIKESSQEEFKPSPKSRVGKKRGCFAKLVGAAALLLTCGFIFILSSTYMASSGGEIVKENEVLTEQESREPASESELSSTAVAQHDKSSESVDGEVEEEITASSKNGEGFIHPTETSTVRPRVRIINDAINVRSGPGTEYEPIGVLYQDDVLSVLGSDENQDWYEIELKDGTTGWVGSTVAVLDSDTSLGLEELNAESEQLAVVNTPDAANEPRATSTAVPSLFVELSEVSQFEGEEGSLILIGEATNLGSEPAKNIDIRTTLYDENGGILGLETSSLRTPLWLSLWFTGVLYPGETAPFWTSIDDPGNWETIKHEISYEKAEKRDYEEHYSDLEVINDTGRDVNDLIHNYQVAGEIKNTGEKTTGPVRVVITLYDEQGNVVGQQAELTEDEVLEPGQTIPFKILEFARGPAVSYSILMRAIEQ